MLYDEDKSNHLSFKEFNKFLNDYRMNVTDDEREKIFKLDDAETTITRLFKWTSKR